MHDDTIKIGGIIRAAREAKGMTQKKLSEAVGIAIRTVIDIEKDKHLPKTENLYSIIRILDIPADYIFRPGKSAYTPEQEQLMSALGGLSDTEQSVFMETAWTYIRALRNSKQGA